MAGKLPSGLVSSSVKLIAASSSSMIMVPQYPVKHKVEKKLGSMHPNAGTSFQEVVKYSELD